jgi:hypothetical protein
MGNTLTNSIVRGFGFTIGKRAANSAIDSFKPKEDNQKINWENVGWVEGDTDVEFDHKRKGDPYQGLGLFITTIFCLIPYIGIITCLSYIPYTFFKKFKTHYFDFEKRKFVYQDGRYKNGIREEFRLVRVHTESIDDTTVNYKKMRILWFGFFILSIIMINLVK